MTHALTIEPEVAKITRHEQPTSETGALLNMIERAASNPDVDMDKFERLMAMKERAEATAAKGAYSAAFADMQGDLPVIRKGGKGHNDKTYARWEDVNEAIRPVLVRHGFSLSFRTKDAATGIEITAVLLHRGGHSEETTKTFPADGSGSKNAIQALGSSISYGKRYAAVALLNLTTTDEDDDGKAASAGETINDEQLEALGQLIRDTKTDTAKFCAAFGVTALVDLPQADFKRATTLLNQKRAQKK